MSKISKISISDIGVTITGKTPSSDCPEDFGKEYMFVTPTDNFNVKIISKTERYLSKAGKKKLENKVLLPFNIMVTCIGSAMGKVAINKTECITNQQINSIIINKEIYDTDYIYYAIKNNYKLLRNASTGSTALPLLNKTDFDLLQISVHKNLIIQQRIAAVLSFLDSKIELNNRINAELEVMAKLIYDYWFVQFDFPCPKETALAQGKPQLAGKPYKSSGGKMVYNQELKREIPEGWEVKELGEVLRCNYNSIGKNSKLNYIEYLDTSNITNNVIVGTQHLNYSIDKIPSRAQRIIKKNDILYSTVRPNLCHYGIIKQPVQNMVASSGFVQLDSKNNFISNDLIYTFLTSNWVTERLHQIAALSVSAYPSISPNDIMELKISLPQGERNLNNMNLILDNLYTKISLNQQQNKQLSSIRDWLLPMLMNGQVSVGDAGVESRMVAEKGAGYGERG